MWLFRCHVATNVASKGILLDTAGLDHSKLQGHTIQRNYIR